MGARLMDGLRRIGASTGRITEVRGAGLMIGADLTVEAKPFLAALLEAGFVAGPDQRFAGTG